MAQKDDDLEALINQRMASMASAKAPQDTGDDLESAVNARMQSMGSRYWPNMGGSHISPMELPQTRTEQIFSPGAEIGALTGASLLASKLGPTAIQAGLAPATARGFQAAAPLALPLMGLVGGGMELAKMTGEALESAPTTPKTSAEALARLGQGAWRGISGELIGQGLSAGVKALIPSPKTAASVMRVATGIPEREGAAVLRDPKLLSRAKSVSEAGEMYDKALEGAGYKIESGGKGSRVAFGKTMLSPEQTLNKFDELIPAMENGQLDLQSAVALRQTASSHLKSAKGDWFEQPMREVLQNTDNYIEQGLKDFPAAVKAYREAKIAEEFGSWLPLNKNLSPNVLRSSAGLYNIVRGAQEGNIPQMVIGAGVSPKLWGYGIQAGGAAAPLIRGAEILGTRAGGQAIARENMPMSTEELLRKKYLEQK